MNDAPSERDAALLLRPCRDDDLPAIERIAAASVVGITTLPPDRAALRTRIERSLESFGSEDAASGEESYLFVLEDLAQGRVVGTSGIAASAGFRDRFYTYRNEFIVHASEALGTANRIHTLHLCHDLTGHSLLTSFYIDPAYEQGAGPQLLSRARLLYMAEFRERFADRVAAESPGLCDEHGDCPFWAAVGERFFDMRYAEAERLSGGRNKSFIAELLPQAPIYVPLLPERAQLAIGQLHAVAEIPFAVLMDEGFEADTYVDIFDGGPTVEARFAMLRSVRHGRRAVAVVDEANALTMPVRCIVATTRRADPRATMAIVGLAAGLQSGLDAGPDATSVCLSALTCERLGIVAGDAVRVVAIDLPAAADDGGAP